MIVGYGFTHMAAPGVRRKRPSERSGKLLVLTGGLGDEYRGRPWKIYIVFLMKKVNLKKCFLEMKLIKNIKKIFIQNLEIIIINN